MCPPLKKRAIEGEVKRSVALKPVPSDCSAGLPICVFQFNECGECWEVYVIKRLFRLIPIPVITCGYRLCLFKGFPFASFLFFLIF